MQVKKQQLELDIEQWTGSKLGKEYAKDVYRQSDYLNYMQSTSYEMLHWMTHKLESRLLARNINDHRYANETTSMAESKEELKSLLMKMKEESEKAGLKLSIQKTEIMASNPITSWQIDRENEEILSRFIFLGFMLMCDRTNTIL